VHPSVSAKSVPDLIAYAKANPGKVTVASAGVGRPHRSERGSHVSWTAAFRGYGLVSVCGIWRWKRCCGILSGR
jgi:tripartite-type tricarboxylate transporter receptor subunit TctC